MEESNIIIGHLQLEQYDQIINLVKNKNKDDKIETLKKNNIQKCIQWCDKHKIPYNKFVDKLNIFLPIVIYEDVIINAPELVHADIHAVADTDVGVNVYADVYADIDDMHEH